MCLDCTRNERNTLERSHGPHLIFTDSPGNKDTVMPTKAIRWGLSLTPLTEGLLPSTGRNSVNSNLILHRSNES